MAALSGKTLTIFDCVNQVESLKQYDVSNYVNHSEVFKMMVFRVTDDDDLTVVFVENVPDN